MRPRHYANVEIDDDIDCFAYVSADVDLGDSKASPPESPSITNLHIMVQIEDVEFEVTSSLPEEARERVEQKLYQHVYENFEEDDVSSDDEESDFTY